MELLEKSEVERRLESGDLADWQAARYRAFRETMTDESAPFPCYFAVEAQREGSFRYVFPGPPDDDAVRSELADALAAFLDRYKSVEPYPALVALFRPPDGALDGDALEEDALDDAPAEGRTETPPADVLPAETYKRQFWDVLRSLQARDPEPWPTTVPTDPGHPKWQFCFAGEPLFLVGRAPFYERRRSRYAPYGLEITVQPWGIFDGLTGLDDAGQEARTIIRERLASYDDVPMHPDAGDFVDPRKREWKQYLLPETNEESVDRCPLPERDDVAGR